MDGEELLVEHIYNCKDVWMQIIVILVSQDLVVTGCGCLDHDVRAECSSKISAA
jgi:hypothetical protein